MASRLRFIILVVSSFIFCSVFSTEFENCGPDGVIKKVEISPCNSTPCIFALGTNVSFTFVFESPFDATELDDEIKGVVRGKELPFPRKKMPPCDFLTPQCPLKIGQEYTFSYVTVVKPFYPAIPIKIKYSLIGDGKPIVCFMAQAKLLNTNPKKNRRKG